MQSIIRFSHSLSPSNPHRHPRNPSCFLQTINANPNSDSDDDLRNNCTTLTLASTRSLASAIRKVSTSPVEFTQRLEKHRTTGLVLPSPDFHTLCLQQLQLFRRIVPEALLSVYVRPAGSYVMDRLELRRVALYPGGDDESEAEGILILVGHFNVPTGLRAAETALSELQVLFEAKQWDYLVDQFKQEFCKLYGMTLEPLLNIYLQAGLSALKTPYCYEDDCTKEDPLSQEAFRTLALPLPYSKQHHSKLVCYISKELMVH